MEKRKKRKKHGKREPRSSFEAMGRDFSIIILPSALMSPDPKGVQIALF